MVSFYLFAVSGTFDCRLCIPFLWGFTSLDLLVWILDQMCSY